MHIRTLLVSLMLFESLTLHIAAQDHVRLTVGVTASDGAPAWNLKQDEFSVQDAGKPRTLDSFTPPTQKPAAAANPGSSEYSNVPSSAETSGAVFVVLDTIHTRYVDERDAREMILKFLARAAQAKHAVTLAILSEKGLHVYHDYHSGSDVLLAALVKAGLGGMKGGTAPAGVNDADVTADAARLTAFSKGDLSNALAPNQLLRSIVELPLVMFQDVGFAAYGLPGRKALIWVTNAVPFDISPKSFQFVSPKTTNQGVAVNGEQVGGSKDVFASEEMKRLVPMWRQSIRALFEGGVAVYPVEVRGASSSASDSFSIAVMKLLAQLTGGKAFYGSNDPFPEILQASNGNTAGYALGFAAEARPSNDLQRVQVSVKQSGLVVNAPVGYFPYQEPSKSRAGAEIALALQSSLEYTGIPFSLEFTGTEPSGGKQKVNMTISLGGDSGVLNEAARKVDLGIVASAVNAKGETVGKLNESAGGAFPPEAVAQVKDLGFQLKRSIEVPAAGDYTLHMVIRDNQNGRMGSLVVPLSVK